MSGVIEDECWVCGTLTKNRCSACTNRDPGVDVFLCSRACQKLVNPIHRIFCGNEHTNPFRFPPLSSVELAHAKENLHSVVQSGDAGSLAAQLVHHGINGRDNQESLLDSLSSSGQGYRLPEQTSMLCRAIVRAYLARLHFATFNAPRRLPIDHAIGLCSLLFNNHLSDPWYGTTGALHFEPPPYLTPFLHRFCVYAFLVALHRQEQRPPFGEDDRLQRYLKKHVQTADPEGYEELQKVLVAEGQRGVAKKGVRSEGKLGLQ